MSWFYDTIIKDDLPELWEEGFKQVGYGNCASVALFPDDTCLALYAINHDPDGTRTAAQIARFSERDAETYLKLRKVYLEHLEPAYIEQAFSVAPPVGVPGPMEKALANPELIKAGLDPHLAMMTLVQALSVLFESEGLIAYLLRTAQSMGMYCDEAGTALLVVTTLYSFFTNVATQGTNHSLAHALHRALYRYGAETFTHSEVDKAIIENGVARGIQLKDGTRIEAKKAVISTLSPHQLCYDLVGPDYLSPQILRKIDALETSRTCIAVCQWVLTEYPKWKAHDFNSDIDGEEIYSGMSTHGLGTKEVSSILEECSYRRMHRIPPEASMIFIIPPPEAQLNPILGYCQCYSEIALPPAWAYPEEWWIKYQHELPEWKMSQFQKYMVDMSWDKVVGLIPVTPYYIARHLKNMGPSGNWTIIDMVASQMGSFRPIPELAQHRTPIKNLYATGSGLGNWGMSSFCTSYTCYKVMSEDYGLRKPWEEQGRPYTGSFIKSKKERRGRWLNRM
jgi:beta-carotene ketolase (CrtO type)